MSGHLHISDLTVRFGGLVAVRSATLDFPAGSLSAVIGPNGAGKTTLFNMVTGHLAPSTGSIRLDGQELVGLSPRAIVRRGVGRAFQVASLFPTFTALEAMAAAVLSHRRRLFDLVSAFPAEQAIARARDIMASIGISRIEGRQSSTLSHGDRKLLDIALSLALEPRVLLLDEPTAGMGVDESRLMIDRLHELWSSHRMTLIFIEHDMEIVFKIAQQVCVLRQGAVLAQGTPEEIRVHPQVIEAYLGAEA